MSGTRLHSQRARATENKACSALLIVAHGERGGAGDDRFVYQLDEQLRDHGGYTTVQAYFIRKEPSLKSVFDGLPDVPSTICPLFMSDGYFVKQAIPRSINKSREVNILAPVGLSRQLPQLVMQIALQAAQATGWSPGDCNLLLVAHGSKHDRASREATRNIAKALEAMQGLGSVSISFLEESPFLDSQLESISGPVLVAGLFIGQGMHGSEDVPRAIKKCRRDDVVLLPPMTQWPDLAEMICNELNEIGALIQ